MADVRTTIVVSQRELYTPARQFVEPMLDAAGTVARVVVVDGGSPSPIREWLDDLAVRRDLLLLRVDHALAPCEARAAALPFLTTEFTAFVDNDVTMSDGWLATLEHTADATGAWAVGPLYLHGYPTGSFDAPRIHMAGGRCRIIEVDGRRRIDADMASYNVPAADAWPAERFSTELLEYHCLLVRSETVRADGMHDDRLLTGHDHYDLCLKIAAGGGECWLEPAATLFYERPQSIDEADRELYALRWSRAWDTVTLDRFIEAWNLDPDDPDRAFTEYWHGHQRRLGYVPVTNKLESLQRKRRALADATNEARAVGWDRERRRAAGGSVEQAATARVVHSPDWAPESVPASAEPATTY
jgi:GT2 family glycosyltransferase